MGLKRRYKIKKQQRWERRMARKKLAAGTQKSQPTTEDKPAGPVTPPQPTVETPPTSTQTK